DRQMVHAEGVVEPGVGGSWVHQVRPPELPDVAQALELRRVDDPEGGRIETDGVPERIPDGLTGGCGGHAPTLAVGTGTVDGPVRRWRASDGPPIFPKKPRKRHPLPRPVERSGRRRRR